MNRINSTRFISQEELAKQLCPLELMKDEYEVGGVPLLVKDNKVYVDASDSHTMIFGATGSKKSRMFVMPSVGILVRGKESFVVTDPKGEIYQKTAGDVHAHGYEVQCMNLRDFSEGFSWNPLTLPYDYYHNGKRAKAMEFVTEMASMIIGNDKKEDAFWFNSATDVFTGFILLLFETAKRTECNLRSLAELWKKYIENRKKILRAVKEKYGDTIVYQKLSGLDNAADKTVGSIEAFISMGLNRLSINEEFLDFLSVPGVNLEQLIGNKMAVYLVIPDENKSYHFVVSLFLEQLYEVLISKAQDEAGQKLPIRMNFLIDEFANIPKIDNMDAMITAARSRNIRFHLIVQGMKQLRQKYGEVAEVISGNCNNWVYLYSKEFELLQEISRLCGEVIYDNNIRMPLFSEFDLQHLSKEKGEALVLAGRSCPCISNLADIDEYPFEQKAVPEQKEKWRNRPVQIIRMNNQGNTCYSYPMDDYATEQLCGMRAPEISRWVVGVGPDGMILVEGKYTEMQIQSEYAFHKLLETKGCNSYIKVTDLEWYTAPGILRSEYVKIKEMQPEKVYFTLGDFGKEKFLLRRVAPFRKKGSYIIYLKKGDEILLKTTIPNYGEQLGVMYAHNIFFEKANALLAGTEYEMQQWDRVSDMDACKNTIFFEKTIDNKESIIGYIGLE